MMIYKFLMQHEGFAAAECFDTPFIIKRNNPTFIGVLDTNGEIVWCKSVDTDDNGDIYGS